MDFLYDKTIIKLISAKLLLGDVLRRKDLNVKLFFTFA